MLYEVITDLPQRALVVVPEHLAVVLGADRLVADLHAAYARIDLAARPSRRPISCART